MLFASSNDKFSAALSAKPKSSTLWCPSRAYSPHLQRHRRRGKFANHIIFLFAVLIHETHLSQAQQQRVSILERSPKLASPFSSLDIPSDIADAQLRDFILPQLIRMRKQHDAKIEHSQTNSAQQLPGGDLTTTAFNSNSNTAKSSSYAASPATVSSNRRIMDLIEKAANGGNLKLHKGVGTALTKSMRLTSPVMQQAVSKALHEMALKAGKPLDRVRILRAAMMLAGSINNKLTGDDTATISTTGRETRSYGGGGGGGGCCGSQTVYSVPLCNQHDNLAELALLAHHGSSSSSSSGGGSSDLLLPLLAAIIGALLAAVLMSG